MRRLLTLILIAGLLVGAAGCGTKTVTDTGPNGQVTTRTVPKVAFAKTKFLLHTGLAFGAFHRYILKPLKAGTFKSGADGRTKAFVKAAAAALFAYHELNQAHDAALSSDLLRRKVVNPLESVIAKIKGLPAALKGGDAKDILGASGGLDALKSAAGGAGANITDRNAPIP